MELFVADSTLRAMQDALAHGLAPSARERAEHLAAWEARSGSEMPSLRIAGDVAEIRVEGVLTKRPDLFARLFGGGNGTYRDLQDAIAAARADSSIKRVVFRIDSPGGSVDGLFETLQAIEGLAASKPITVRAENAYSAAYAIAAATGGRIEATSIGSGFGSVGVAASYLVNDRVVDITNTDSPNKRPDVSTDAGRAVVRKQLDAIHELVVATIARGRKTTAANVIKNFGRGGSFVAGEALERGMIDRILGPQDTAPPGSELAATDLLIAQTAKMRALGATYPDLSLPELALVVGCDRGVVDALERQTGEKVRGYKVAPLVGAERGAEHGDHGTWLLRSGGRTETRDQATGQVLHADGDLGDQVVAIIKEQGGL